MDPTCCSTIVSAAGGRPGPTCGYCAMEGLPVPPAQPSAWRPASRCRSSSDRDMPAAASPFSDVDRRSITSLSPGETHPRCARREGESPDWQRYADWLTSAPDSRPAPKDARLDGHLAKSQALRHIEKCEHSTHRSKTRPDLR